MTAAKLSVAGLDAAYGQAQVLFDVSFNVAAGEAVALLGRNGAGKSTTFRAILGLIARRSGTIVFDGEDLSKCPTYEIVRHGLGYVPEDRRIFSDLTVEENLQVGRQPPRPNAPTWTPERLFAIFPNLRELRGRAGARISGGEQQMLTIARTLMGNPSLLLLDEPSEGLAPRIVEQMIEAIREMKREGLSLFVSEQNLAFARLVAERVYVSRKAPSALAERWRNSTPGPTCAPISPLEPAGDAAVAVVPGDPMRSPAIQGSRDREEPYVLDEQVGFALRQAQQRHTTIFAARMIEDLTPTQWAALAKLRELGDCSQNHLGRLTAMDAATIKGVIDRLTARGFTTVRPDPRDGRRILVALTPTGSDLYDRAAPIAALITEKTLEPLGKNERSLFVALLRRLA